jgi:hypothetical protein
MRSFKVREDITGVRRACPFRRSAAANTSLNSTMLNLLESCRYIVARDVSYAIVIVYHVPTILLTLNDERHPRLNGANEVVFDPCSVANIE